MFQQIRCYSSLCTIKRSTYHFPILRKFLYLDNFQKDQRSEYAINNFPTPSLIAYCSGISFATSDHVTILRDLEDKIIPMEMWPMF